MRCEKASGKVTEDRVSSLLRHSGLPTPIQQEALMEQITPEEPSRRRGAWEGGLGDRREARDL